MEAKKCEQFLRHFIHRIEDIRHNFTIILMNKSNHSGTSATAHFELPVEGKEVIHHPT